MDINLNNVESDLNKSTNVNTDQASNTKYPSVKAVFDWATNLFFPKPTGTTAQYLRGDGSLETFPTIPDVTGLQSKAVVVSGNTTAVNDGNYTVVANATFTDPSPVEGKGYRVFVRNGTATINSVGYTVGTSIFRVFHSGAWVSYVSLPDSNFVPTMRTINGYDLSANRTLTASDVGAPSGSGTSTGSNTGDETQSTILSKLGWFQHNRVAESTAVTGTTAETIIENITIPANTFTSGGILRSYNNKFRKVGTAGSLTVRLYIGPNANNLSGATQIAIASIPNTNLFAEILRTFTATTTSLLGWASATSSTSDVTVTTAARTETAVTWSVTQNLIITVQLGNGADSVTLIGASLKNF
jgi:hypothetical protein